jgi:uncharacterized protein YbjQ (UPF0145 family)
MPPSTTWSLNRSRWSIRGHNGSVASTARAAKDLRDDPFVSDLSVAEFLLTRSAGFEPLGLVFGCSVFHAGTRPRRPTRSSEIENLSQGLYTARQDAIRRMEDEADTLDASGVVGVRLSLSTSDWTRKSVEFIAVGTAVGAVDGSDWRTINGLPFTSDLSGRDFWTLTNAGYRPLGFVMGTCVYHVGRRKPLRTIGQMGRNVELSTQTQALYSARELAMSRMQDEASAIGAAGVVGSHITESTHVWRHHLIEFLAIGTAIAPLIKDHVAPKVQVALSVDR